MRETVLQFGAGNFLRAFADLFVEQANRDTTTEIGSIVVVQTTGRERADALTKAGCRYHVAIQGFQDGSVVDEVDEVRSISRALFAGDQWDEVLSVARSPDLQFVLSNTTEAGFVLSEEDREPGTTAAVSFPAKLLQVLMARFEAQLPGLIILPCELHEDNATKLRALVEEQARRWDCEDALFEWLGTSCCWLNNLVDRIVPGTPKQHHLLASDPLLISAEPYATWVIERHPRMTWQHPCIVYADAVTPYSLRKVRILNGAHSALVAYALPKGLKYVRECMEHPEVSAWLERLLFEEIIPVLDGRVADPAGFARATLERFRNPFLDHALSAIALNHEAKMKVRLQPTIEEYQQKFGRPPPLLSQLIGFNPTISAGL